MNKNPDIGGLTLADWLDCQWWPLDRHTQIMAGFAGHDREIVINIDGYGWGEPEESIPDPVVEVIKAHLPSTWKVESRSTRIELHPTGSFAGGYTSDDVALTSAACHAAGLKVVGVHLKTY